MPVRNKKDTHFLLKFTAYLLFVFSGLLCSVNAQAQTANEYDEVPVYFNVQNVDNTELTVLVKDEKAYLPVSYVFDFLKILNKPSASRDSLSGFFINEAAVYLLDAASKRITYQNKVYDLKPGELFKSLGTLYLLSDDFGKIFGLNCDFNFRNLSVKVTTLLELPVMRESRLNSARNNALQGNSVVKADTTIRRTYPAFHFGMADWSVINTRQSYLGNDTRVYLGLGGVIGGGETNVSLNYSTTDHFDRRNQFYSWRLANNDNSALRQIVAGKIYAQTISSVYAPILGFTLTNTPTTFRRAYGTYTLTNTTFPNWLVELYVNNVLVGFVRTDAAGLYTFQVPLVYGSSQIKLRFYGPSGEERYTEQNISIPYSFLPKNEFEYNATGGIVDDGSGARFSRISAGYGLSSRVTVGGGTEYLSSITTGTVIPFVNTSARLFKNLLVSGEYDYNVRTRAVITYNLFSGLQIEYNDTWYKRGQTAIFNTFLEERKGILSIPLRTRSFAAFTRFTFDQIRLADSYYTTTEWLLSGSVGKYIVSVNTYGVIVKDAPPFIYSNFALTATLFRKYLFTQQVQVDYRNKRLVSFKDQVERRFSRNGYINFSLENDLNAHLPTIEVGLRYDFRFAQAATSVRANKAITTLTQSANGSVIFDGKTNYVGFKNNTNVGKGGITVLAFLDLNNNGKKDPGEPKADGIKLRLNGGRIEQNIKDTTIRITDLEPYISYIMEIDPIGFENIAWRLKKHNFSVAVDPNQMKIVNVPVTVSNEVSGRVSYVNEGEERGLGRLIIGFYSQASGKLLARTTTEQDGYYTFMGLPPGDYYVKIDPEQVRQLQFTSTPELLKFRVKKTLEGDVVDGLEFVLKEVPKPDKKE